MKWKELKLQFLLRLLKPDIVHVHWAHFAHPVTRTWNGPIVVTAWGSDIYRENEQPEEIRENLRKALKVADIITCDSSDIAGQITSLAEHTRMPVEVIQWGVDTKTFFPGSPTAAWSKEINGGPIIFSARNFTPLYNQDIVVKAFSNIRRTFPEAQLIMKNHNGDPAYLEKIESIVQQIGITNAVRIFDSVPYEEMADFYRASSVTLSIPSSDATPMALLEAMACGSIPVFSDLPSIREWIRDGWNGVLIQQNDANLLADKIIYLLTNPELCAEFKQRNMNIVKTQGSQTANMNRMDHIYHQLAQK